MVISEVLGKIRLDPNCDTYDILLRVIGDIQEKPHPPVLFGDRGSTVVKALSYKSEGRWFDPR